MTRKRTAMDSLTSASEKRMSCRHDGFRVPNAVMPAFVYEVLHPWLCRQGVTMCTGSRTRIDYPVHPTVVENISDTLPPLIVAARQAAEERLGRTVAFSVALLRVVLSFSSTSVAHTTQRSDTCRYKLSSRKCIVVSANDTSVLELLYRTETTPC